MRAVFGVVSLLIVLAIVGLVATRQLTASSQAVGPSATQALPAAAATSVPLPSANVREQSQQLQQKVKDDLAKAMAAGAAAAQKDESQK